jgi:hypothetical protein
MKTHWLIVTIIGLVILFWLGIPYLLCQGLPSGAVITTTTNGRVSC